MAGMTNTGLPHSAVDQEPPTTSGWVFFAALMIVIVGIWNILQGLVGFFQPAFLTNHDVGGPLWVWALLWIVFGVLQIAASAAIMSHRSWGRWFGIVTIGLAAFVNLLAMPTFTLGSISALVIQILVLVALSVHWRTPGKAAV